MEYLRELFTAFVPKRLGWINNEPAYYRKRLLHRGYQILIRHEVDEDPYVTDILEESYFSLYKNGQILEEVYQEILAK